MEQNAGKLNLIGSTMMRFIVLLVQDQGTYEDVGIP